MNIISDSFYLTLSKGIRTIVMMAVIMVMTRITSLQVYGTYRQLITLSTMALSIAPLGLPVAVSYYYKNINAEKKNKLISNTIIICFACGIISFALFIIFKNQISNSLNIAELDHYLISFCLYVFILVASSFIENLYVSAEFSKKFSIYNIIYYVSFLVIIVRIIINGNGLSTIFFTMFILEATRFVLILAWILQKIKFRFNFDISFIGEQFMYCIPLGLVGIMQYFNTHLDKLLISSYFTSSEFAVYATGTMEIPIVNLVTLSLATAALPHMSKEFNTNNNIKGVLQIWGKITATSAAIIFPLFFILGFYNKGYIGFLFSEKYFSCIPVFLIHLLRLPFACTVFGNILIIMGKQKKIILNMLITIIVNIICTLILVPVLGMEGATLSGVITQITIIMLQLYQISRFTKIKIKNLLPYKHLLKIFGLSFIVVLPMYILSNLFNLQYIVKFIVFGSLSFFISIYTLIKFNLINFNVSPAIVSIKKLQKIERVKY